MKHHQLRKQLLVTFILLYDCGPCLPILKKKKKCFQAFETKCLRKLLRISETWSTRSTTGCGARSASLWVHRNIFWLLSRDGNLHGSGMSHATTASPKPTFRAPWRMGDAVVSKGNAGWTTSKSGHPCPCKNCSQWPPAEKTGRGSLLNRPPSTPPPPPDDSMGKGTELNWIESFSYRAGPVYTGRPGLDCFCISHTGNRTVKWSRTGQPDQGSNIGLATSPYW